MVFIFNDNHFEVMPNLKLLTKLRMLDLSNYELTQRPKINDDKILCQKILNEVGFAMLPGSDFGLKADKLLTRIAFVDFDGLAALKIIKDDDFSSNNLLDIICPRIVKGVSLLKEWVQNQ